MNTAVPHIPNDESTPPEPRLAVFVSGSGRTLANLLDRTSTRRPPDQRLPASIALVVASKECPGADIARNAGVETHVIPAIADAFALERMLRERRIDWVVLAGYVKRLPIPASYDRRIVNIHPALLPKFGGRGMYGARVHAAVLAAGETRSGCTVHLVDDVYDNGDILEQASCPVLPEDTPETLGARVFELEKQLYPRVLAGLIAKADQPRDSPTTGTDAVRATKAKS